MPAFADQADEFWPAGTESSEQGTDEQAEDNAPLESPQKRTSGWNQSSIP